MAKMKNIKIATVAMFFLGGAALTGCTDYLDTDYLFKERIF